MSQITAAEFEQMLDELDHVSIMKWADLEVNTIYTIVRVRLEHRYYGESMSLTLADDREVWAPDHLKERITRALKMAINCHFMSDHLDKSLVKITSIKNTMHMTFYQVCCYKNSYLGA